MKTILVCKSGTTFRPRSNAKKQNSRGEQGETEGIIRHLKERGDVRVVYFGTYDGDESLVDRVVRPNLEPVKPFLGDPALCPASAQHEGWRLDTADLKDEEVVGLINVTGYSPTMSTVDNGKGAIVQAAAIQYVAPMHNVCESLEIPRCCVVTDPRCYPRDQEMSFGWKWVRPRALLDQSTWGGDPTEKTVGGLRYMVKSRYAACESWGLLEKVDPPDHRVPSICVAHAHVTTGIRKSSWSPWLDILSEIPDGFEMWGEGWEGYPGDTHVTSDPDRYDEPECSMIKGPCNADKVLEILSRGYCCPVVEHTPWFLTGKPYVIFAAGSIPLLYGTDVTLSGTYDPAGKMLSLGAPQRIQHSPQLVGTSTFAETAQAIMDDSERREELMSMWAHILQPKWNVLDELVDKLLDGKLVEGEFGTYRRL